MRAWPWIGLLVAAAAAGPALADDQDADALTLADKTAATSTTSSDWRVFAEAGWSQSILRADGSPVRFERLSLDLRYDANIAPDWRFIFADRLDVKWQDESSRSANINTLKEAYLSWQPRADRIADAGRINVRYGVASGYNPTDYFRAGAVRSIVSIDPASLRENRLGSVMLRGQTLWTDGSLTALYSPKLADQPNNAEFSPDFGATNRRNRWLIAASHKVNEHLNPQWLLDGGAGQSPRVGVNVTTLVNDATVAYLEWSGGRTQSLLAQAGLQVDDSAFRSRLATGVNYTTADKLSLTFEYEYNGAGLDRAGWDALRRGSPAVYGRYRGFAAESQDIPTRDRLFVRAAWQDAFINHFDLTMNLFFDRVDSSRQAWLEARYHWSQLDLALQWQLNSGAPGSEYGALPERRVVQAIARWYF